MTLTKLEQSLSIISNYLSHKPSYQLITINLSSSYNNTTSSKPTNTVSYNNSPSI